MSWRTNTYRELGRRLSDVVGGKTAAEFAKLGLATVDDLMRHVPRRYLAGTEMSDFGALRFGEDVAVVAKVHHSNIATSNGAIRVNSEQVKDTEAEISAHPNTNGKFIIIKKGKKNYFSIAVKE